MYEESIISNADLYELAYDLLSQEINSVRAQLAKNASLGKVDVNQKSRLTSAHHYYVSTRDSLNLHDRPSLEECIRLNCRVSNGASRV